MKRSYYFWIATVPALAFGLLMFLAPGFAATQFQLAGSPATDTIFRVLGSVLLGVAVVNFLVRRGSAGFHHGRSAGEDRNDRPIAPPLRRRPSGAI